MQIHVCISTSYYFTMYYKIIIVKSMSITDYNLVSTLLPSIINYPTCCVLLWFHAVHILKMGFWIMMGLLWFTCCFFKDKDLIIWIHCILHILFDFQECRFYISTLVLTNQCSWNISEKTSHCYPAYNHSTNKAWAAARQDSSDCPISVLSGQL